MLVSLVAGALPKDHSSTLCDAIFEHLGFVFLTRTHAPRKIMRNSPPYIIVRLTIVGFGGGIRDVCAEWNEKTTALLRHTDRVQAPAHDGDGLPPRLAIRLRRSPETRALREADLPVRFDGGPEDH